LNGGGAGIFCRFFPFLFLRRKIRGDRAELLFQWIKCPVVCGRHREFGDFRIAGGGVGQRLVVAVGGGGNQQLGITPPSFPGLAVTAGHRFSFPRQPALHRRVRTRNIMGWAFFNGSEERNSREGPAKGRDRGNSPPRREPIGGKLKWGVRHSAVTLGMCSETRGRLRYPRSRYFCVVNGWSEGGAYQLERRRGAPWG